MRTINMAFVLAVALGATASAQTEEVRQSGSEGARTFFPRNWLGGYLDVALAPPHNEPDLNRCASWAGTGGGNPGSACSAFARYVASGYLQASPIGAGALHRVFLFWEPHLFLGRNLPQVNYNFSAAPMSYERAMGVGIELPRSLEIRMTQHRVQWLGRYNQYLGTADLGRNGPLGLYTTVSARWYFGSWARRR
jgi:hypothetical protein